MAQSGRDAADKMNPMNSDPHNPFPIRTGGARLNILLDDDDPSTMETVSFVLKRLGHNVRIVHDDADALHEIREAAFHHSPELTPSRKDAVFCSASNLMECLTTPPRNCPHREFSTVRYRCFNRMQHVTIATA